MKTKVALNIPVTIFKEGDAFIAYSSVLDLSTSAKTFALVQKRFNEVVEVFFEELLEMGTVDEVLGGLGWEKARNTWAPPVPISHEIANIKVPLAC